MKLPKLSWSRKASVTSTPQKGRKHHLDDDWTRPMAHAVRSCGGIQTGKFSNTNQLCASLIDKKVRVSRHVYDMLPSVKFSPPGDEIKLVRIGLNLNLGCRNWTATSEVMARAHEQGFKGVPAETALLFWLQCPHLLEPGHEAWFVIGMEPINGKFFTVENIRRPCVNAHSADPDGYWPAWSRFIFALPQ